MNLPADDPRLGDMHILLVTFQLHQLSEADYSQVCETTFAPAFEMVPGLLTKTWLADAANNTYGGVYVWKDRAALAVFQQSELFASVANHPNLTNLTARDFAVLESPTRTTRGWIE